MATKKLEQELEAIAAWRERPGDAEAPAALAKALRHRSNLAVAKAARVVEELGLRQLEPELKQASERYFRGGEADPQCWAKNALTRALSELGCDEPDIFLLGLRYRQMEKVWGGQTDTATALRAQCAHALVNCRSVRDLDLLYALVEVLFDEEAKVRAEASRALGRLDRAEAALLLRARCLAGDAEPEVVGAALGAVLAIEGEGGRLFVARFLERDDEVAAEAALALSQLRSNAACELLIERVEQMNAPELSQVLMTAIALTRTDRGDDYLRERAEERTPAGERARKALDSVRQTKKVES